MSGAGLLQGDSRLTAVCALATELAAGQLDTRGALSGTGDAIDKLTLDLNSIAARLAAKTRMLESYEARLNEYLDGLGAIAALDFSKRLPLTDAGDTLDAIAMGLNILTEELHASMVSKFYVEDIIESLADPLLVLELDGSIRDVNGATLELFKYQKPELAGQCVTVLLAEECLRQILELPSSPDAVKNKNQETMGHTKDGQPIPLAVAVSLLRDASGHPQAIICVGHDITERKRAEGARQQALLQQETIRAQTELLRRLSTPLIPVSDRIVVMPLIGAVNAQRMQQAIDVLLTGVAARGVEVAIIDITGVSEADAQVANGLIDAARAVRLLGAQAVFTGIHPEVARLFVRLNIQLDELITYSTLQAGIEYAMGRGGTLR